MGLFGKWFVDVKRGTKVTYSESDLRKLDRTYEKEVFPSGRRKIMSPLRKAPQQAYLTQIRDYAFEKILDGHMYTFAHLLVVPNPYDLVKQSALILFNSSKLTKVRYRVLGDTPEADFVGETEYTRRHRVPVMGLYLERSNKVELEMIDEKGNVIKRRMLRIYVSETPKKIIDVVGEAKYEDATHFPFILVNGVSFNPLVVDCNSAIRYSLQLRTNSIGMIPLENGHFLYEDRTANRMNVKGQIVPCRYHEMDYMGRVYRTFLLDFPIMGAVAQKGNSLYLVTSSDEKHIADKIIELDINSGSILKECNLCDVIGDKYRDCENWANISHLCCQKGSLLITLKRLHTILKMDWKSRKIRWILAPKEVWEGTELENYCLKGNVYAEEICRRPDSVTVITKNVAQQKEKILIFEEHSMGEVKLQEKDSENSGIALIEIDDQTKKFQTLCVHDCVKNQRSGSALYSDDQERILACAGCMKKRVKGKKSKLVEIDSTNGEVKRELYFAKLFNKVWQFKPDIKQFSEPVAVTENVIFGRLSAPAEFHGTLPPLSDKPVGRENFSSAYLCENIFLSYIMPSHVDRIYFVGENHTFVQDYSNMISGKIKFPFAVALEDLPKDEYYIYVERNGMVHKLKNEIRVVDEVLH